MSGFLPRERGVIGTIVDFDGVIAELIAHGIYIHPQPAAGGSIKRHGQRRGNVEDRHLKRYRYNPELERENVAEHNFLHHRLSGSQRLSLAVPAAGEKPDPWVANL